MEAGGGSSSPPAASVGLYLPPSQVSRRGARLHVVPADEPAQPEQLAVAVQRVPPEVQADDGVVGRGADGPRLRPADQSQRVLGSVSVPPRKPLREDPGSPGKQRVRGQGPQPVGGHVQPGQLVQLPEDAFCDVVDQVVVQVERVEAGHVLDGLPRNPGSRNQSLNRVFQDFCSLGR